VDYHDPYVPRLVPSHGFAHEMDSVPLSKEMLPSYDAVLILTDHSELDYAAVVEHGQIVIDTRNATRNVLNAREKIVKA
jgi:UDP-N-acetyl-D-glucosamine dehydrogenase